MKKNLFILMLMLLTMVVSASAAVEIEGIYYDLDYSFKTAAVTSHPNYYSGDVNGDGEVGIGDIISITNIMSIRP